MESLWLKMRKYALSFIFPVWLSLPLASILSVIEKYLFADWEFLKFLVVFMAIDTFSSGWYHIQKKDVSSKGFSRLFTKIIIYSILLVIAHGFASYTVGGVPAEPLKWFRSFICTALLIREGLSIVENLNKVMPGIIPPIIAKYLRDFDEKGNE